MKNKVIALVMILGMLTMMLSGCGGQAEPDAKASDAPAATKAAETKEADKQTEAATEAEAPAEVITLRFGVNINESHPLSERLIKFTEYVEADSKGKYKFDFYFGGQLGDKATHMQSLQTGVLDLYMIMPGVIADYGVDTMNVLNLPYLFDNVAHARAIYASPLGDEILGSIQASGSRMVGVGAFQEAPRNFFFTDRKVTKLSEMEGLKIRTQTGSMYVDLMNSFGASATPIAFSELYSALQTGVVDGAEQPYSGFYNNKFNEICKYMVTDEHQIAPNIVLMSELTWNQLSEEDQAMFKAALAKSIDEFTEISKAYDEETIQLIKDSGVEILAPDDPSEWKETAAPLYETYGIGFEELIEKIQTFDY